VNPRATIALFIVTLLVVGGLIHLRRSVDPSREAAEARRYAVTFNPAVIDAIDLVRGKETVSLRRDQGGWFMTAPVADRADPAVVEQLLLAARFLDVRDREPARDPSTVPESGLGTPRVRLELRGDRDLRLDLGSPAALPGEIFARVAGRPFVLRVPDTILAPASAPAASFRDPRMTDLLADDIEKFTVRRADGEMTVRLERGRWIVEKPVRAPADPRAVRDFLDRLLGLRITSFEDAPPASSETLPGQTAQLALTPRGGGDEITLELRRELEEEGRFRARFAPRGGPYDVDAGAALLFDISPEALRDRTLGRVEPDTVDRIVLESGGRTAVIRRHGDGWVLGDGGRPLDPGRITTLIDTFNATRVASFEPAADPALAGLEPPVARVRFFAWLTENTAEEPAGGHLLAGATLGAPAPDGHLHARVENSGETVLIPPDLAAELELLLGSPPPETP
jgi:hypothetical protein